MLEVQVRNPIIAADFAKRLDIACDNSDVVPEYNRGRQSWIANELLRRYDVSVSKETVRKWFAGEARPRHDKMKALAALLKVDEAWLALGMKPDAQISGDRRLRSIITDGAIHLVIGMVTMSGGSCAFPDDKDPRRETVHFYTIIGGRTHQVFVSVAQEYNDGFRFTLTHDYTQSLCIGVVQKTATSFDLFAFPTETIAKHGKKRGGYIELQASVEGRSLVIGDEKVARVTDFKSLRRQ